MPIRFLSTAKPYGDYPVAESQDIQHGDKRLNVVIGEIQTVNASKADKTYVDAELAKKVDKETGKGLSTNDYTTAEKTKLAGIAEGATNVTVDSTLSTTSTNAVQNKAAATAINSKAEKSYVDTEIAKKVDKETGKGLSTNDYTTAEKTKLAGIATGATKVTVDDTLSSTSSNAIANGPVTSALSGKVDKVTGKGLSTNDYTSAEKTKLSGIEAGATKTIVDDTLTTSSTNPIQNKAVATALSGKADSSTVSALTSRVSTNETNIATQTARIDEIAALPEGSTTGDAELMDIRVGADSVTYTSAGAAVRAQITDVKSDLSQLNDDANQLKYYTGTYVKLDFTKGTTYYSSYTVETGKTYHIDNTSENVLVIFVKGHQEAGEYITIQAESNGDFTAKYNGVLTFYSRNGLRSVYKILINGKLDTKINAVESEISTINDNATKLNNDLNQLKHYAGTYVKLDFTTNKTYHSSYAVEIGKTYHIENTSDNKLVIFAKGHQETGEYITIFPNSNGDFTSKYDGTLTFYSLTDLSVVCEIKICGKLDEEINSIESEISIINDKVGYSIELDYTSGTTSVLSSLNAISGKSYTFVNKNDAVFIVFVDGHQETGEYVKIEAYSSARFDAQYSGLIRFYQPTKNKEKYSINVAGTIQTDANTVFTCTPTSGFYKALNHISQYADADVEKVLYVSEGTYDLYSEIGGVDYANTITDYNNWENDNVIIPKNLKIIGVGKVIFQMNIDASELESTSQAPSSLAPINATKNCSIENIIISCSGCRYGYHIEGWAKSENNNQTFYMKNVNIHYYMSTQGFGSALGIGINKGCTLNIDHCILKSEKSWGIGGHLNNGSAIININDSVLIGGNGKQSFAIGNHVNASESIFTFKNSYVPTVDALNTDDLAYKGKFVFAKTDTSLSKTKSSDTISYDYYGCTVTPTWS